MDIKKELADFKKKIDREIESFFNTVIKDSEKKDPFITDTLRYAKKMTMVGGKRIRPALMYWGYKGCGGKEEEKILKAAVAIELIHIFLLIHDDIIDRDEKRHGIDTMHFHYEKIGRKLFSGTDNVHFGRSIAVISGDMIGALGNKIIFDSEFDPRIIMKALSHLQSVVSLTVIGQAKDIFMEYNKQAGEKDVMSMYEYKTARYTLEGPLQLGAILAGAGEKVLKNISRYAIPIGIAFQIQDDILGIFGSEKKIGKAVGADIKEGKQTLLLVKAKELADRDQRKILAECVGNETIDKKDIADFQKVIIESGALEYAKKIAAEHITRGKREIAKTDISSGAKDFLLSLAEYMMEREV